MKWTALVVVFGFLGYSSGNLAGPYLMWGHEKLQTLKLPVLTAADKESLSELFARAKQIILFIRNSTSRLDGSNYPKFRQMISNNYWVYLPQYTLAAEPFHHKRNVKVINLVGPALQQDSEITVLFKNSVALHGEGNVLGMLAGKEDEVHHMFKKAVDEKPSIMSTTEAPAMGNFIYRAAGKAILYTTSAPVLNMDIHGQQQTYVLLDYDKETTFNEHNNWSRLNVGFNVNNTRLRLRFNFTMSPSSFWSLNSVEVEYKEYHNIMPLVGPEIIAPKSFSYRCSTRTLFFRNEKDSLTIMDYQVQPWLNGANGFSNAYDCVGFTTIPIWSGLFVSTLLVPLLLIGILTWVDIKPLYRFESSRNKRLIVPQ